MSKRNTIAIVGRPNVGKSTLLNLLAGFDRAIVTPVAGTTRDIVEQAVQLGSVRLNLFDTAGVREVGADGDAIEAEGMRVRPVDISQYSAVEVDFETDLARANSLFSAPLNTVADVG